MKEKPKESEDLLKGDLETNFYQGMSKRYKKLEKITVVFDIIKSILSQKIKNIYRRLEELDAGTLKQEEKERLIEEIKGIFNLLDFLTIEWNQKNIDEYIRKRKEIYDVIENEVNNIIKDKSQINETEISKLFLFLLTQRLIRSLIESKYRENLKILEQYFSKQLDEIKNLTTLESIKEFISKFLSFSTYLNLVLNKKDK